MGPAEVIAVIVIGGNACWLAVILGRGPFSATEIAEQPPTNVVDLAQWRAQHEGRELRRRSQWRRRPTASDPVPRS